MTKVCMNGDCDRALGEYDLYNICSRTEECPNLKGKARRHILKVRQECKIGIPRHF